MSEDWDTPEHFKKDKENIEKALETKLPWEIELEKLFRKSEARKNE